MSDPYPAAGTNEKPDRPYDALACGVNKEGKDASWFVWLAPDGSWEYWESEER